MQHLMQQKLDSSAKSSQGIDSGQVGAEKRSSLVGQATKIRDYDAMV